MHRGRRFAQVVKAGAAKASRGGRAVERPPPGEQAGIGQCSVSAGKPRRGGRIPKARRSGRLRRQRYRTTVRVPSIRWLQLRGHELGVRPASVCVFDRCAHSSEQWLQLGSDDIHVFKSDDLFRERCLGGHKALLLVGPRCRRTYFSLRRMPRRVGSRTRSLLAKIRGSSVSIMVSNLNPMTLNPHDAYLLRSA